MRGPFAAGVLALAFALRLGALLWTEPTAPVADEQEYLWRSTSMVEGRDVPDDEKRPPGILWWFALFHRLAKPGENAARFANVVAGTAGVLLLGLLGTRLFGRRVGLAAAALAAVYPNLVMYSASLWSECLYVALVTTGLLLLVRSREGTVARPGIAALAGVAFGLAALTREVGVGLVVLGAALWRRERGALATAAYVAAFAATILPWTARLNRGDEPFALVTRTTYLNLFLGNAPADEPETEGEWRAGVVFRRQREYQRFGKDAAERESRAKEIALRAIADRMPAWPLEKVAEAIPALATPNSLPAARLLGRPDDEGWAGRWSYRLAGAESARDPVAWLAIGGWCVVALAGVAGWCLAGGPEGRLLAAFVALHVLPAIVAFGCSRFRIPIVPVLLLGTALLAVRGRTAWREASPQRRGIALGAAGLLALVIASRWSTVLQAQWG